MTQAMQRRVFLMSLATVSATAGTLAHAQALVDEKDLFAVPGATRPQAAQQALGGLRPAAT
jgi:hypothetical protein